eukprot:PRCOL_00000218-RA
MPPKADVWNPLVISDSEEYHAQLCSTGCKVVEAYSAWCGPCQSVLPLFRRLITDLEDRPLTFITALSDSVEMLEEFKGRSEPTFLVYRNGRLNATIRSANTPALEAAITANTPMLPGDDDIEENPTYLARKEAQVASSKAAK